MTSTPAAATRPDLNSSTGDARTGSSCAKAAQRLRLPGLQVMGAAATLALLSACASHAPQQLSATQEAAQYAAHARGDYSPPGPPEDPWGPYITEASSRFDVPDRWIREVMRVESGGRLYHNDTLVTSPVGAMGLMQVMPSTFDDMRGQYNGIGDDPYDPHDSILAGTAYIRQMYDVYGSPGFLAAYNAGPGNLDAYLTRNRRLPAETRRYVAMIAPYIRDSSPVNRSQADMLAMNHVAAPAPDDADEAPRPVMVARNERPERSERLAERRADARADRLAGRERLPEPPSWSGFPQRPVQVAAARGEPRGGFAHAAAVPSVQTAAYAAHPLARSLHFISPALAEPVSRQASSGGWAIQVGAFGNQGQANAAAGQARQAVRLADARSTVAGVRDGRATLYRARVTGLSREGALHACEKLGHVHGSCMVVAPSSQG